MNFPFDATAAGLPSLRHLPSTFTWACTETGAVVSSTVTVPEAAVARAR